MKTLVLCAASALALASAAQAQSAGQSSSITADLNRAPTTQTAPRQTTPPTATPSTTPAPAATSPTASRMAPPPQARPAPAVTARPTPAPAPAAQAEPEADAEAEVETAAEPAPPAPPLTAAQIAALPFTLSVPTGFRIVEGASGDDFDLWTVRRGDAPAFVTIYAGERSNYPIYGGREITAGGRTSVVVNEGQGDRAMEHIFLRASAPREVHIWVGSVADADRAVAEAIAQSVDVR